MIARLEDEITNINLKQRMGGAGINFRGTTDSGTHVFVKIGYEGESGLVGDWIDNECNVLERLAAGGGHPHTLSDHHVFQSQWQGKNATFIVLPYLAGRTFADAFNQYLFTPEETLRVGSEVCSGLAYWHAQGLIHRDVKPMNIFLERTQEGTQVRVIDAGFASIDFVRFEDVYLAGTNYIVGTPHYMAPEACRRQRTCGPESDVYSLGLTLLSAMTGDVPFHGSPEHTLRGHTSRKIPRKLYRMIPEKQRRPVKRLLQKALRKKPWKRFRTMEEMGAACLEVRDVLLRAR